MTGSYKFFILSLTLDDIANQEAVTIAGEHDNEGVRTIGILDRNSFE